MTKTTQTYFVNMERIGTRPGPASAVLEFSAESARAAVDTADRITTDAMVPESVMWGTNDEDFAEESLDVIGCCEGCSRPILETEPYHVDDEEGYRTCGQCLAVWEGEEAANE